MKFNKEEIDLSVINNYLDKVDKRHIPEQVKVIEEPPDLSKGFSTADLEEYIEVLNLKWIIGTNIVLDNKTFSRNYSNLIFPQEESIHIEEIDLGYEDEELEGRYFYRLVTNFIEENYSSSKDFYKWDYEQLKYKLERYFHNQVTDSILWERECTETSPSIIDTNSEEHLTYFSYEILPTEFIFNFNANKALGVKFTSDHPFTIEYEDTILDQNTKVSPLISPEVKLIFKNVENEYYSSLNTRQTKENPPKPSFVKADLYGTKWPLAGIKFMPLGEIEEAREILIHRVGTELEIRKKPPGKMNFRSDFWNETNKDKDLPTINTFFDRKVKEPELVINKEEKRIKRSNL